MSHPTLKVEVIGGHVVLLIKGTEVFDYVEDFLIEEHDLVYSFVVIEETNAVKTYMLHFQETSDPTRLQTAVDAIDPGELQKIWNISN